MEKLIKDSADKIESSDKENLESKVSDLREKIKSAGIEDIKSAKEALQKDMYEVSTKLYQKVNPQASSQNGQPDQQNSESGQNVYNADYKEVDPENK